ncbi:MAG: hypothetical protein ACFFG0_41935 [Candidatus Thorarchaeota archaeon]
MFKVKSKYIDYYIIINYKQSLMKINFPNIKFVDEVLKKINLYKKAKNLSTNKSLHFKVQKNNEKPGTIEINGALSAAVKALNAIGYINKEIYKRIEEKVGPDISDVVLPKNLGLLLFNQSEKTIIEKNQQEKMRERSKKTKSYKNL